MATKVQGEAPAMAIAFAPVELPPGFRFHPTDQDLVNFYLKRKILLQVHDFIPEVDLYSFEPWDLADKSFSPSRDDHPGADRPKVEFYLFGPRGRKYANGLRKNRATPAGFWKSTGKDRPVMHQHMDATIGMKKTLVYHLGRAPNGVRTGWVMHEYRLQMDDMTAIHDTYALCRVFKKTTVTPPLDAGKEEMKSVLGGAEADKDVPRGAAAGKEEMKSVPGGAEADNDNSWMQYIFDDALYSSVDANMDESCMQFVSVGADANMDGSWMQFVTEQQELLLDADAGPSGEAARVDDGAAGLELVGGGAEGGGQEEDEE